MATWADVEQIMASLQGVTVSTKRHAWDLDGRMLAWDRPFSKADVRRYGDEPVPDEPILAVRCGSLEHKDELLAAEGGWLFSIPHLDGYSAVLLQLDRAEPDALADLITECRDARAPRSARSHPAPTTTKDRHMVAIGDHVSWNTEQGRTRGKVTAKKTKNFQLAGHRFTASEDEPMFVVKSDKTGSTAAHRPSALRVLKS